MPAAYREVILSDYERMHIAPYWAHRRWIEAEQEGRKHQAGFQGDGLEIHLWGVLGEIAYAKAHKLYFEPTVNTFKAPDIDGVQIRTALGHALKLIIRPRDDDLDYFVLVTVDICQPSIFRVHGGMAGGEAKQHNEWYRDVAGRPPAWFVPQDALYTYSEKVTRL